MCGMDGQNMGQSLLVGDEGPGPEEVVLGAMRGPSRSLGRVPVSGTEAPGAHGEERIHATCPASVSALPAW